MLGGGQTARHKGREHLLSHCHSRDRVQICMKSFFSSIPDKHSTMQHNLQLEVGGEQDMDCYCSSCWELGVQDSRESPGGAQVSAAHTKLSRGICLLKGTTILRMHLLGHTFPLEPDPLSCISKAVQVSKILWKEASVYFLCRRWTPVVSH